MKLAKDSPVVRWTRWLVRRKGLMKLLPTIFWLGGWLIMIPYSLLGAHILLLTTKGRKTGISCTSLVMYTKVGNELNIAAHGGGSNSHPDWYLKLQAEPNGSVEQYWRRRTIQAEPVTDDVERSALLAKLPMGLATALQEHTSRAVPVLRLRPAVD